MYKVLLTQKGDLGHLQLSKRVAIFHSLFDSSFNSVKKFLSISICLLQQIFYFPFSQSQQLLHLSPSTPTDMWVPHVIPFLSLLVPLRRCHHKSRCARDDGAARCDSTGAGTRCRGRRGTVRSTGTRRRWRRVRPMQVVGGGPSSGRSGVRGS